MLYLGGAAWTGASFQEPLLPFQESSQAKARLLRALKIKMAISHMKTSVASNQRNRANSTLVA